MQSHPLFQPTPDLISSTAWRWWLLSYHWNISKLVSESLESFLSIVRQVAKQ